MKSYMVYVLLMIVCGVLFACAPVQQKPTAAPSYAPEPYIDSHENVQMDTPSLFEQSRSEFLFSDNRARQVGDLVMVKIEEFSSAENEAKTNTEKDSSLDLGVDSFFGRSSINALPLDAATGGLLPGLGPEGAVGSTPLVEAGSESKFEGSGDTNRTTEVKAIISARVVRVMEGGVMQIEGARNIKVNGENQIIVVRGLARARDVASDNSILHTQLADAHIEVYGKGIVADKQKPGWLTQLLDRVWPF
ncbi:MAG: flagellar basal body L-ring protein FlgH [Desulfonatronovibrio sp.]